MRRFVCVGFQAFQVSFVGFGPLGSAIEAGLDGKGGFLFSFS